MGNKQSLDSGNTAETYFSNKSVYTYPCATVYKWLSTCKILISELLTNKT